jgi:ribosomal protein L29
MAILRVDDIKDMSYEDIVSKKNELRFELAKSG